MKSPKVFISYSHDSQEHRKKVLELSDQLRADGIDAIIDQYELSPKEGWYHWMEKQICNADFVILICTEKYFQGITDKEKPGESRGVKWEGNLIYQSISENETNNERFIPVIFEPDHTKYIPRPLRPYSHHVLNSEENYNTLCRLLTGQPKVGAFCLSPFFAGDFI